MRTIIFDFDGTIGDSFKVLVEIGHHLTHHNSLVVPEELERLRGMKLMDVAEELEIKKYQWPFLLFRGRRLMTKRLTEVKPFPGIDVILGSLSVDGYKMYIMSSNSKHNIDIFLAEHGMATFFTKVYGNVGLFSKARALRKILKENDLTKKDVLYVGDEPRDIEAAKHEGIACVAVGWGFNKPEILAEHAPMVVVRSRPQLLKVLEEWATLLDN